MADLLTCGRYRLGDRSVRRMGYGAMQLAGPNVFGPPRDRDAAIAVLRAAVEAGVDHIDTSDFYGPHIVNGLIREALSPYPDDLVIVTKVGARRDEKGAWLPAMEPDRLIAAVEDNRRNLARDVIDVVNMRVIFGPDRVIEGSIAPQLETLAELQAKGVIRHIGISNATPAQIDEARGIAEIVCVQNFYNLVHRDDDALIDSLADNGIAYVPFFPLGGFMPLQSSGLEDVARSLGKTPMQVAIAWLLQRSPNILAIPGTSSLTHLSENLGAAALTLDAEAVARLDEIGNR